MKFLWLIVDKWMAICYCLIWWLKKWMVKIKRWFIKKRILMLCFNVIRSFPIEWSDFLRIYFHKNFKGETCISLTFAIGYMPLVSHDIYFMRCFRKWYSCCCAAGCCWIAFLWACCSICLLFRMAKNPNFQEAGHLPTGYVHCRSSDSFTGEWTNVFSWDFNLRV